MAFFVFRHRFSVEGIMPERALLRLQRAGICVYNAQKIKKNQILFSVSAKDSEKVFAIYPNVCYNISAYSPFVVRKIGVEGIAKYVELFQKRVGFLLGGLLFWQCSPLPTAVFWGWSLSARPYTKGKRIWHWKRAAYNHLESINKNRWISFVQKSFL